MALRPKRSEAGPPGSLPRDVRLTAAGAVVAMLAVILAAGSLASGVLLYVFSTRDQARNRQYERDARTAEAEVIRIVRHGGEHPWREAIYRYAVSGREYEGRAGAAKSVEAGSRIPVRYLASEPERSWLPGQLGGVPVWLVAAVPPPLAIGALAIARAVRRQRRLLAGGRIAEARITGSRRVRRGEHTGYRITYEFRTLSGALRTGSYERSRRPLETGGTVTIVYDPDEPRRSALYPLNFVRALQSTSGGSR